MEIYITLSFHFFIKTKCKLLVEEIKIYIHTKATMFDIKSDTKEFTRKLKPRERFSGIEYDDESLVKSKSNTNVNTAIPELPNIPKILEQI